MISKLKTAIRRRLLQKLLRRDFYFRQTGYCPCCCKEVEFLAYDAWLRDYFLCSNCGSIPRQRALLVVMDRCCPGWQQLTIHESSPSPGGASARLKRECSSYFASQYFHGRAPGELIDGFRNEDLCAQTLEDESVDIVVTQDVMEHVYGADKVFQEIARTLKPGGSHVFAVPLINKHLPTEVWATAGPGGEPVFLHEPEYHGNPIDPRGAPVTMHWGFDIVDHIARSCGLKTRIEYIDDLAMGIRAEYIEILVTHKPHAVSPGTRQ